MSIQRKKILAVDIDATMADIQSVFIKLAKERHGVDVKYEDINGWNFWMEKVGTPQTWQIFKDIWVDHWEEVQPTEPDVQDSLYKALGMGYEITVVTGTQKECIPFVSKWLDRQKVPYKSLVGLFSGQSKYDFPWTVLIDDNPNLLKDIDKHRDRKLFLYDQPWNRGVHSSLVTRVKTFDEMLQELP